jgi:hypothetical protein
MDGGWAKRLALEIGGPRGCSHLLTLGQLVGATVDWGLEHDRGATAHRPGERIFRRDVVVDGHERTSGAMALALQLTDLHHAPAPPVAPSMARFAAELEVRALAEVDLGRFALAALALAERRRDRATLDTAPWRDRAEVARPLVGLALARELGQALLGRRDATPEDRPLADALLMLAPAVIQCVAALSETWPGLAARGGWIVGMGGCPDACYMWRSGGALERMRGTNEPPRA